MTGQISIFGQTPTGRAVHRVVLQNDLLAVSILTHGAVLQSVRLAGVAHDLTLGSDRLQDYLGDLCYHGSVIAPVVNRLSGASAQLGARALQFERNFLGRHVLHSGSAGVQHALWDIADHGPDHVTLALSLADGAGGFPGHRAVQARYTLAGDTLRLDVQVRSDQDTLWNAANHSYWNLDGGRDFTGHRLQIDAAHYLPTTDAFFPTGEIVAVGGTAYDFRQPHVLGPGTPPLDNCFCLSQAQTALRPVLTLRGASGITLRLSTTEAGVQLYDCRHDHYRGLAIEAQNWPDAPHHAGFPSITLAAGQTLVQSSAWQFSKG
jgi:aldose 1-epimerase